MRQGKCGMLPVADGRRLPNRHDAALAGAAVVLGLALAAAYGAYRAVSADGESAGDRFAEFATAALWPGSLIAVAIAVIVVVGWKIDLD